ncbi:MAG: YkgJ family cysteine cluster protein [bacterium]|nr:YkgJ family cysteine cluster protein [bacterium]
MPAPLITDLDEMRRLADARYDEFQAMAEALEFDESLTDDALDALVESLAAPIAAAIDCTQCANCCRSLDVCLIPPDIDRLSTALVIPIEDVITRYADEAAGAAQGEWALLPAHPCPFLKGNLCSIYQHRPNACRIYPQFTPDIRYNLEDTIEGAFFCPIIYNTLSALAERVSFDRDHDEDDEGER